MSEDTPSAEARLWRYIDSDEGTLTQFCLKIGVQNVEVQKVNLGDHLFNLRPIYGFMMLIKHNADTIISKSEQSNRDDYNLFFANQMYSEAYLLHGLLHILLNCNQIDIGTDLNQFKQLTSNYTSKLKGHAILKNRLFREAYSDMINAWPYRRKVDGATYHSVSYVLRQGNLWELDALKDGPCILASCNEDNWLDFMQAELVKKAKMYQELDLPISIWAVIESRKLVYQKKLTSKLFMKQEIENMLDKHQPDWRKSCQRWEEEYVHALSSSERIKRGQLLSNRLAHHCSRSDQLPNEEKQKIYSSISHNKQGSLIDTWLQIHDEILRLYERLGLEDEKDEMYKKNYIRKRHNYIPFIQSFIQALVEQGHFHP
ncbi:unnamed protein product [Rhizopus microsporus]